MRFGKRIEACGSVLAFVISVALGAASWVLGVGACLESNRIENAARSWTCMHADLRSAHGSSLLLCPCNPERRLARSRGRANEELLHAEIVVSH